MKSAGTATFVLWLGLLAAAAASAADNVFEIRQRKIEPNRGTAARIELVLPEPGRVSLVVFNMRGEPVAALFEGFAAAGPHQFQWRGVNADGRLVASGAYVIRVRSATFTQTRKVVVIQ